MYPLDYATLNLQGVVLGSSVAVFASASPAAGAVPLATSTGTSSTFSIAYPYDPLVPTYTLRVRKGTPLLDDGVLYVPWLNHGMAAIDAGQLRGIDHAPGLAAQVNRRGHGVQLRASVDNPRAARGVGIHVERIFTLTFALGTALAGLGGAMGVEMLGLDPGFPVKYVVYFLIVVAVGGSGSITGSLVASLILGVVDVAGKYYVPEIGSFLIYAVMVVTLVFRPQGLFGRKAAR